jgi:flavin-binding protein dodecin
MDVDGEWKPYNEKARKHTTRIPFQTNQRSPAMTVAKVTEIIASSTKSFDDAILIGVARAHKTLKNLKSAWVKNQQIKLDGEGKITEYRVQLKVTFLIND